MKKIFLWFSLCLFLVACVLSGCGHLEYMERMVGMATVPEPIVVERGETVGDMGIPQEGEGDMAAEPERQPEGPKHPLQKEPIKGIYVSAYVAGTSSMMDSLIEEIERTELNALVIDIKDDYGRVACNMDSALIQELGSVKTYIPQMEELTAKLHERGIYVIARIPAFRDAWLGDVRPDWCVKLSDGTVFRDKDGNAWVNPYKQEAWDYLVEIAVQAKRLGFDEIQFDYMRFCTEKGMQDAVFDESDTQGRSRTEIILECMEYMYGKLKAEGLFVSADVYGAIINNDVNAKAVGQIYGELAKHLDYISPMIYPSHYGDGNYGIDHPDLYPYETILAALTDSKKELYFAGMDGGRVAQVRPWLQDFTASWLENHIPYGPRQVRQQIQAAYDAGYDEWLLWDASCQYDWDALMTPEEAQAQARAIAESRAALPETTWAAGDEAGPAELEAAPVEDASSGEAKAPLETGQ